MRFDDRFYLPCHQTFSHRVCWKPKLLRQWLRPHQTPLRQPFKARHLALNQPL